MVRLYRSPSPGKRRYIENESDISATRSPICGASVLGKIRPGKSNSKSSSGNSTLVTSNRVGGNNIQQPEYVSIHQYSKRSLFGGSSGEEFAYESIGNSPTFAHGGRKSPESTESSTSGTSSHGDGEEEDNFATRDQAHYVLQFEPKLQESGSTQENSPSDDTDRLQLRMERLQAWMEQQKRAGSSGSLQLNNGSFDANVSQSIAIRNRAHMWSTNLPVVTEERSFEMEDSSSIASGTQSLKDEVETPKNNGRTFSSPERNEMLLAMRQLVLKQQAALSEMAEENKHYRRDLQECRKLLQLAKEAYTKQQRQVDSFMVEKESTEAEVLWLREEVKTLRAEIYKHQEEEAKATWTSTKSSEEVEERLRKARAETPERRRKQEINPAPSPIPSPIQSPVASPPRDWKLKSMLPEMNYLSDEAESDDELMKEFQDIRATLTSTGISANTIGDKLREHQIADESRDDGKLSPSMWQDENSNCPDDESREVARSRSPPVQARKSQQESIESDQWARSRSPVQTRNPQDMRRSRQLQRSSNSPAPREPSRTPSEVSVSSSNVSSSSALSQRSREEVALFKSRLGAIQKKREQRKQIEENVGSRSGRVRFT